MNKHSIAIIITCVFIAFSIRGFSDSVYNEKEIENTFTIEEVDIKPIPIEQTPPQVTCKELPLHSRVVLAMVISETGSISSVRCNKGVSESIDRQVIRYVKRWKFRGAEHMGEPAAVRLVLPIRINS